MARQKDTHWSDIKAALEKRGTSLATIALKLGISRPAVTRVKRAPNARLQSVIAEALGLSPQDIWPSRYYVASGKPIRPSIWLSKNNRVRASAHVKNRKAA